MQYLDDEMKSDLAYYGIELDIIEESVRPFSSVSNLSLDGFGIISYRGQKCDFYFEEESSFSSNKISKFVDLGRDLKYGLCIISDMIPLNIRRDFKENGISYLCRNHTYHIVCDNFIIFIDPFVGVPRNKEWRVKRISKSQLSFLTYFLFDRTLIDKTNAEIAQHLELSVGAVSNAINFFAKEKFITKSGKKRKIGEIPIDFTPIIESLENISSSNIKDKEVEKYKKQIQKTWIAFKKQQQKLQ